MSLRSLGNVGRVARLCAACLAVVAVWACGPVYIPVPPPSETTFTAELVTTPDGSQQKLWITAGGVNSDAALGRYFVYDDQQQSGVIATARNDGSFEAPAMPGTEGDHVFIYFEDANGRPSPTACRLLSELRPVAAACP